MICRTKEHTPPTVVNDTGIVFYVYSRDRCHSGRKYMDEVTFNAIEIRKKDPSVYTSIKLLQLVQYCIDYKL